MSYLSIIIPCYNVEAYIPKTIESLSNLTDADSCEFIFVNDGSTDNTLSYLQAFAKKDSRAIILDQHNQGVSAARNAALQLAKGEFVLFLDGDDYILPNTISIIKKSIKGTDALLTPCIVVSKNHSNSIQPLSIQEGIYSVAQLYANCQIFPTAPMIVYKNSIIKDNNLSFDITIKSGEVYTFSVDFFQYADNISVAHTGFYHYVMRSSSATHYPNHTADLSVLNILDHFSRIHQKWTKTDAFKVTALKMILSFTYNKYVRCGLADKKTIITIQTLFASNNFQELLKSIPLKSFARNYRIFIFYIKIMPPKIGYLLCVCIRKIIKI